MTEKFFLIALFFLSILLFAAINRHGKKHDLRTQADYYIPFWPIFVIPYVALYPYVGYSGFILFITPYALQAYLAVAIAMFTALAVWYLYPSKMHRPHVRQHGVLERMIYEIYRVNPHANAFPSAHVFTVFITAHYMSMAFPDYVFILWIQALFIAASTVLIKQHHAVDFLGGVVWAFGAILIVSYITV